MKRPDPRGGLLQDLDENYVASVLWHLWDGADLQEIGNSDGTALGYKNMIAAFSSERMTNWSRGADGADLVDFIDAALCLVQNQANNIMTTVTQFMGFPYDGTPYCQ